VLLRERNMLATQREEMRRMGVDRERFPESNKVNSAKVRCLRSRFCGDEFCSSVPKVDGAHQGHNERAPGRV
jgi:hypothetical protein